MSKTVNFGLKSTACFDSSNMVDEVMKSIYKHVPLGDSYFKLRAELEKVDLSNYYDAKSGSKVTKSVRKCMKRAGLPTEPVESKWDKICNRIASLYHVECSLKVYYEHPYDMFDGQHGDDCSCFRYGGVHEICGKFVKVNRRMRMLVVKEVDTGISSRCLVYFQGGRTVCLTNFYYGNGAKNDMEIVFVEAFRRLMNIDKCTFNRKRHDDFSLPIYLNGDSIKITTPRSFEYEGTKWKCPHCGTKVGKERFVYLDGYRIGCSKECANSNVSRCTDCGCRVDVDEMRTCNDCEYCQSCYDDRFTTCSGCDRDYENTTEGLDGEYYCSTCYGKYYTKCSHCSTVTRKDDMVESFPDGAYYCDDCIDLYLMECEDCGHISDKQDRFKTTCNGKTLCIECFNVKEGVLNKNKLVNREEVTCISQSA